MKVAVVGSGVSGLAATWVLNEFSNHEVHLYEADNRVGGHANTVSFKRPGVKGHTPIEVDTGFIVFNPATYPNFLRFLELYEPLKSAILPTEMTFSVSRDGGAFEWAGNGLRSVFCQPSRLFDRKMWRLLYDVLRFNACSRRFLTQDVHEGAREVSIGEYLDRNGFSDSFRDNYLVPMTAAIWSTPPDKCALDFPARTLIQFMSNHHLLQIIGKPSWLTLRGGSRVYVNHIVSLLPKSQLHLSTPVHSVSSITSPINGKQTVVLETAAGAEVYDHVIFACHSDTTLEILRAGNISDEEETILSAFQWNKNEAILHCDVKLMPQRRLAWSCWNYLTHSAVDENTGERKANVNQVALTYCMNHLQHLPEEMHGPVLVTLNPPFEPDTHNIVGRYKYDHPVLNAAAIRAQRQMYKIQNTRGISYAGAWMNYGFHEDGFTSGLRAAMSISSDVRPPFEVRTADRPVQPVFAALIFDILEGTSLSNVVGGLIGMCLDVCNAVLLLVLGLLGGLLGVQHIRNA